MCGIDELRTAQIDNVYFGNYQQTNIGTEEPTAGVKGVDWYEGIDKKNGDAVTYFSIDPIKWRVLSKTPNGKQPAGTTTSYGDAAYKNLSPWSEGDGLLLFADQNLDSVKYNNTRSSVTWARCTLRSWLNGSADGDFVASAFSVGERTALVDTVVENADSGSYDGGWHTKDTIFSLSINEVTSSGYGFNSNASAQDGKRKGKNTGYVRAGGRGESSSMYTAGSDDNYWLRSRGSGASNAAAYVFRYGNVFSLGAEVNQEVCAVRPALNVSADKIIFVSSAAGGKDGSVGELGAVSETSSCDWKLTLATADEMTGDASPVEAKAGSAITVSHGAFGAFASESYDVVTAALASGDEILYYGAIDADKNASSSQVVIPAGLAEGSYRLLIYAEARNGDYRTDYATAPLEIALAVKSAPARVPVTSVSLDQTALSLEAGGAATLTATITPDGATDKTVTWTSDNTAVATVDGNGCVTAIAPGTATITATANDGSLCAATCVVTVVGSSPAPTPAPAQPTSDKTTDCYVETGGCSAGGYNAFALASLALASMVWRRRK